MAWTRFEVDIMRTFLRCFNLSNCVSNALTTRKASDGSFPDKAPARAAVKLSTSSAKRPFQSGDSRQQDVAH